VKGAGEGGMNGAAKGETFRDLLRNDIGKREGEKRR